jgi:hypothetical protein
VKGVLVESEKMVGRRRTVILRETTLAAIIEPTLGHLIAGLTGAYPGLVTAGRTPSISSRWARCAHAATPSAWRLPEHTAQDLRSDG